METRSQVRLSEAELRILAEQTERQKQRLNEQEAALSEKVRAMEEKIKEIDAREQTMQLRETGEAPLDAIQQALTALMAEFGNVKRELNTIRNLVPSDDDVREPSNVRERPQVTHISQPTITYKDALESVPVFNGYNIPVLRFIRSCKRACDMFPPHHEATVTQLLRNKLKGHASTALEDDHFLTFSELTEKLKTLFGQSKSLNQYRGELGNISKSKNEHIIEYISRVKDLHAMIHEMELETHGEISRLKRVSLENDTMECFVNGLPPNFRMRLKIEGYNNLQEAYAKAIKVEKETERDKVYFKQPRNEQAQWETNIKTATAADRLHCVHCGKRHPSDACWTKFPERRPSRSNSESNTGNNTNGSNNYRPTGEQNRNRPSCSYCSKTGHNETNCYKKQNDQRNSKNGSPRPSTQQSGQARVEVQQSRPVMTLESEPSTSA